MAVEIKKRELDEEGFVATCKSLANSYDHKRFFAHFIVYTGGTYDDMEHALFEPHIFNLAFDEDCRRFPEHDIALEGLGYYRFCKARQNLLAEISDILQKPLVVANEHNLKAIVCVKKNQVAIYDLRRGDTAMVTMADLGKLYHDLKAMYADGRTTPFPDFAYELVKDAQNTTAKSPSKPKTATKTAASTKATTAANSKSAAKAKSAANASASAHDTAAVDASLTADPATEAKPKAKTRKSSSSTTKSASKKASSAKSKAKAKESNSTEADENVFTPEQRRILAQLVLEQLCKSMQAGATESGDGKVNGLVAIQNVAADLQKALITAALQRVQADAALTANNQASADALAAQQQSNEDCWALTEAAIELMQKAQGEAAKAKDAETESKQAKSKSAKANASTAAKTRTKRAKSKAKAVEET